MDIPEEADGCSDNDLLCYSILSAVSERKAQWAMHICKERVWKVLCMLLRTEYNQAVCNGVCARR